MKNLPKLGKLTRHGYRRSKGYLEQDGRLVQKTFWLGDDPAAAIEKINIIDKHAGGIELVNGQLVWTKEQVAAIEGRFAVIDSARFAVAIPVSTPTQAPVISVPVFPAGPLPPRLPIQDITLHMALDQYADFVQTRNEIALKTREMIRQRIRSLKYHLPDDPLYEIGFEQLQRLRSIITARPECRRRADAKEKTQAGPISIMTTRNWLSTLGQAFRWFRKTGRWRKPAELETEELNAVFFLAKVERRRLCQNRSEQDRLTNTHSFYSARSK